MSSTYTVALESLKLAPERRYAYIQEQMRLLIGRNVHYQEAESALKQAEATLPYGCPKSS